jgi:hypothetical protein
MVFAAAHAAAQPFNADFYATVATLIPILFLAIAVQSTIYEDLMKTVTRSLNRLAAEDPQDTRAVVRQQVSQVPAALGIVAIWFVPVIGIVGEIMALLSLYWKRPVGGTIVGTLGLAIILTAITGALPAARLMRFLGWFAAPFLSTPADASEQPAAGASSAPEPEASPPSGSEPQA